MTQDNSALQDDIPPYDPSKRGYARGFLPTALVGAFWAASQSADPNSNSYYGAVAFPLTLGTGLAMMWMNEHLNPIKALKGIAIGTAASVAMMAGVDQYAGLPERQAEPTSVTTGETSIRVCPRFNVSTGAVTMFGMNAKALTMPHICMPQPAPVQAPAPAPAAS